jgi:hypothetical protein
LDEGGVHPYPVAKFAIFIGLREGRGCNILYPKDLYSRIVIGKDLGAAQEYSEAKGRIYRGGRGVPLSDDSSEEALEFLF